MMNMLTKKQKQKYAGFACMAIAICIVAIAAGWWDYLLALLFSAACGYAFYKHLQSEESRHDTALAKAERRLHSFELLERDLRKELGLGDEVRNPVQTLFSQYSLLRESVSELEGELAATRMDLVEAKDKIEELEWQLHAELDYVSEMQKLFYDRGIPLPRRASAKSAVAVNDSPEEGE